MGRGLLSVLTLFQTGSVRITSRTLGLVGNSNTAKCRIGGQLTSIHSSRPRETCNYTPDVPIRVLTCLSKHCTSLCTLLIHLDPTDTGEANSFGAVIEISFFFFFPFYRDKLDTRHFTAKHNSSRINFTELPTT